MSGSIRVGSLCTGYDGLGMGLRSAGAVTVDTFFAEKEAAPSEVLKREAPEVPNLGDIKTVDWTRVGHVDVLTSGDPCQSISAAGRREGRNDPRFLWPDVRTAYREMSPNRIFFENVANMVPHDGGRTMAERFAHLQEDGYSVRWTVLGACAVGAPHHRHRWFCLAEKARTPGEAVRVGGGKAICGAPRGGGRILLPSPTTADGPNGGPNQRNSRGGYDALPGAVVNLLPTPRATDIGTAGRRSSDGWRPQLGQAVLERWGGFAEAIALWEEITGIPAPVPTVDGVKGGKRLNPELPEWMMGLRPGILTEPLARNDALKAAGNGVVPLAAAAAWTMLNRE